MRVIAGSAKSMPLKTIPGMETRPTTDRIKETLFNILQPYMCGCRFLDIFAGSGGIGIEALSRGADFCAFVEKNRKAVKVIEENLKFTRLADRARIFSQEALTALRLLEGEEPFDCIFMDPPYGMELERSALEYLSGSALADENTLIIVEAELHTYFSYVEEMGYELTRSKEYKTNKHVFLHKRK